jgi:hypothetical protein
MVRSFLCDSLNQKRFPIRNYLRSIETLLMFVVVNKKGLVVQTEKKI